MKKIFSVLIVGVFCLFVVGCEEICLGECLGNNGSCMRCPETGTFCSKVGGANCSAPNNGVYCCRGGSSSGGGGTTCNTGCPSYAPWRCGGYCYASPPSGNHSCVRCP